MAVENLRSRSTCYGRCIQITEKIDANALPPLDSRHLAAVTSLLCGYCYFVTASLHVDTGLCKCAEVHTRVRNSGHREEDRYIRGVQHATGKMNLGNGQQGGKETKQPDAASGESGGSYKTFPQRMSNSRIANASSVCRVRYGRWHTDICIDLYRIILHFLIRGTCDEWAPMQYT